MKRTVDGRIIDKRVFADKNLLKSIILDIKNKNNFTWKELGDKLNVSSQTIRHDWLNKRNTIPLDVFKKLLSMTNNKSVREINKKIIIKEPFWGQSLKKGIIKTKKVRLPDKQSKRFAEFYGILLGDGCIFSGMNGLAISGDKILDLIYLKKYVGKLISELFGVYPSYYISKKHRSVNCVVYSKIIAKYLLDMGFPSGIKYNHNLEIPKFIFNKKDTLAACIRGLMDTDGSLSSHPNVKIMIHLSITIKSLRESVLKGLDKIGIKVGYYDKGIMIYGKDKIQRFRQEIGFSNYKNIIKYQRFIELGRVPTSKEVEMFIMRENKFYN